MEPPLKSTVPALLVKLPPPLIKSPDRVSVPEVDVRFPALIVRVANETALLPKLRAPPPAFVIEPPMIVPPTVRVLALVVTKRVPATVTFPVPRFSVFVPVNEKSPFQICG